MTILHREELNSTTPNDSRREKVPEGFSMEGQDKKPDFVSSYEELIDLSNFFSRYGPVPIIILPKRRRCSELNRDP